MQRLCTKCGTVKDISEFSWSIHGVKRHSRCKSCSSKEHSEYYQRTKPDRLKYKWDRQVRKREEARAYVWEYLKTHPCEHCHEADPVVLTFHHVKPKKMDVSQMVNQGYLVEVIQQEIGKCIVLCSNCHLREEKRLRGTNYPSD